MTDAIHDETTPAEGEGEVRAAKRVRFAMTTNSTECTHLAIVSDPHQVEAGEMNFFPPSFTYHAFGKDEQIEGFEGLRIEVIFSAVDFSALLNVTYKDKELRSDDIVEKIASSLPAGCFTQDKQKFIRDLQEHKNKPFEPPGTLVSSYTQRVDDDKEERVFEIYECPLDKNDAAQKLHRNMQTLALWFIEGADAIDVTDPRWVVYVTYEKVTTAIRLPVGFVTVFKFRNPLGRKLGSGAMATETHRICQALIFPTHQRQGHCERLVDCIYDKVQANSNVYEVTVEDPVPGFAKLRDFVDAKHCVKHKFFSLPPSGSEDTTTVATGQSTVALQASDIQAVQEKLKLTQRQVQRCYEMCKLGFIDKTNEDQSKKYRIEVKKRLFKLHAEDLEGMGSERRKAFLEKEFRELEELYTSILDKLHQK